MAPKNLFDKDLLDKAMNQPWRLVAIATWVPTWAFLLAHGATTGRVFPAMGIIPSTLSLAIALASIEGYLSPRSILSLDVLNIAMILVSVTTGFVTMSNYYSYRASQQAILGMFGIFGLLVNFTGHSYMVLRLVDWKAVHARLSCQHNKHVCSQCSRSLSSPDVHGNYQRIETVEQGKGLLDAGESQRLAGNNEEARDGLHAREDTIDTNSLL